MDNKIDQNPLTLPSLNRWPVSNRIIFEEVDRLIHQSCPILWLNKGEQWEDWQIRHFPDTRN